MVKELLKFLNDQQESCEKRKKNDDIIKLENKRIEKGFITILHKVKILIQGFSEVIFSGTKNGTDRPTETILVSHKHTKGLSHFFELSPVTVMPVTI